MFFGTFVCMHVCVHILVCMNKKGVYNVSKHVETVLDLSDNAVHTVTAIS